MKIIYVNCAVKNYMKEDHHSYRRKFCSCERKPEKIQACTGFEPLTSVIPRDDSRVLVPAQVPNNRCCVTEIL